MIIDRPCAATFLQQLYYNSQLEMSVVRRLLDQLLLENTSDISSKLRKVRQTANSLTLQELQQFIRQVSYILYKKQQSCSSQLFLLQLLKELLLTGSFPLYLFLNVYIFPWLISINHFYNDRPISKRAQLLYRDAVGRIQLQNSSNVQAYRELLEFASEFLVFFGENLKFHPYSKYKTRSCLAKQLAEGSYPHSLQYFVEKDMVELQTNLRAYSDLFRDHLKQIIQFLTFSVEECITDPTKYNDTAFLLMALIEMSESYCITTIIYRLPSFFTLEHILTTCQLIHQIVSLAEIQTIDLINIKCLPAMLEYLLPIDFKSNAILPKVKYSISSEALNKLVDYYYIWYDKTKLMGLSTKIYQNSYNLISQLKKPSKLTYQRQIQEFSNRINKMKMSNQAKRSFVIDQSQDVESYYVNLLKEAQFCLTNQHRQRIAYQNVLDELTLSQKDSQVNKMSVFSQSLLRSVNNSRANHSEQSIDSDHLRGPPHKKFANFDSSISQIKQEDNKHYRTYEQESMGNIYYTREQSKTPTIAKKYIQDNPFNRFKIGLSHHGTEKVQESYKIIHQPSAQMVHAKNSNTPQKTPLTSNISISLHSSRFSQKENNINRKQLRSKGSIKSQEDSGDFLHFQKDSLAKSQDQQKSNRQNNAHQIDSDINFNDSLKIHNSQSVSIIQYGIDRNAKLPQTIKKPKFGFKLSDTHDSSLILKDIDMSSRSPFIKSQKNTQHVTPLKNSPIFNQQLKSYEDGNKLSLQNKASNKKQLATSENVKSPGKQSARMEVKRVKSIYQQGYLSESNKSSYIKEISASQNLLQSQQNSLKSDKIPNKFGQLFKRNKREKASSIASSRSLRKLRVADPQVQMPNLKKMRDLQNELGKLKSQTQKANKILVQKQKEIQKLQMIKQSLGEQDPYFLKRQNQIMKKILKNRKNDESLASSHSSAKMLARQLKASSLKYYNVSLKDYNPNILKLRLQNIKGYSKDHKKDIVANRCVILKNEFIQVGYSYKNHIVTLYITLKHYCDQLQINLIQNSIKYSQSIRRQFDKLVIGKQIKFKTQVEDINEEGKFVPSFLNIKLTYNQKLQNKTVQYKEELPLIPYNIAKSLQQNQPSNLQSIDRDSITHYVTPLYSSCEDLLKKGKKYLYYLFPHGQFDESKNMFTVYFLWKERVQKITIKIKQRVFRVQGIGHPLQTGKQLIQAIINMLITPEASA